MNDANRILIIDSSRYEGFRLRRQLQLKSPDDIITIMNQPRAGLDELARTRYDVTIVDLTGLLSYEVNGRKFLTDFARQNPDSRLVIIDNIDDESVGAQFSDDLDAKFGPHKAVIINRDDLTHLLVPGLVHKLLSSSISAPTHETILMPALSTAQAGGPNNLSGKLAHEVNNPLMTIMGTVELLLDRPDNSGGETGRKLRIIQRSARRIQSSLVRIGDEISQNDNVQPVIDRLAKTDIFSKI